MRIVTSQWPYPCNIMNWCYKNRFLSCDFLINWLTWARQFQKLKNRIVWPHQLLNVTLFVLKQLHPLKRITNNFLTIQTPLQGFPQQRIWGMHLRPFPNSNINMSYVFWMWTLSTLTHYLCLLSVWSCLFFIGVCLLILYNVQCLLSSGCVNFICHVFWTY